MGCALHSRLLQKVYPALKVLYSEKFYLALRIFQSALGTTPSKKEESSKSSQDQAKKSDADKEGPADESSNYRPISVLPVVSRLFEKLIYDQLYHYLDSNKLIFGKQSAYRQLHSVLSCLLKCTNDWYLNLEGGKYTAATFVDLKKAFDTVNHEILLQNWSFTVFIIKK